MPATMGLHRVSNDELRRVVRAIYRGHLVCPITRSGLVLAQFGDLEGHLNALVGQDRAGVLSLVQAVLAEREVAGGGGGTTGAEVPAELLWRGPTPATSGSREPLELVADWLAQTERSVLWAGIPAAARHRIFQGLHAAQRGRDLAVQLVLVGDDESARRFVSDNFVHGLPLPRCAFAPESAPTAPPCVIFDESRVIMLQNMAVLLDAEDASEVRSGIATTDHRLAQTLTEHIEHLLISPEYHSLSQ